MDQRSKGAGTRAQYLSLLLLTLVLAAGALVFSIWLSQYPARQAASLRHHMGTVELQPNDRIALEKDITTYETDSRIKIWAAIVQALAGLALLLGLLFTWRNLRATQEKLDIDREGQLTTRFTQAAGQLGAELEGGKPNIEVRLGGIYALARIAQDSPKDYLPIMYVLTAYVRHNAPWPPTSPTKPLSETGVANPKPRTDVQAILSILGRPTSSERKLDLRRTDLRGAEFWDAHLENTDFWGAHLEGAQLWGARLDGAKFKKASLERANMKGTTLSGAILTSACMTGANLEGADLSQAIGLTKEQVDSAFSQGAGASLPPSLLA